MFASERMLRRLGNSAEIYVDGTFKVVPNSPPIAQLYTIHMRVMDTGLAAVFVLCSAKTRALYTAIFRKILELAPEIEQNLRFAMGDYERAAMSALREVFPGASLHGCWFHFKQALLRRWRYLGLNAAPTRILGMAMALPLVPSERFEEGLNLLARLADHDAIEHPNVLQFLSYIRRQWGPLADIVSVHGCPIRTNNLVESFHNEARRKLGGLHPNIWKFIEHLTAMIVDQEIGLDRLENGDLDRRARTRRNMARDTVIRNAQHSLSVDRFTLREFLERCATRAGLMRVEGPDHDEGE
ncbi:uncharacterized protein LOC125502150 [Athalia rosae]|uniref:uncharacterized protein LOC125502150 n=1 Tax=Athalia rosae TaxID=37344 RepID=UPI002033ADAB|nr:uncharacterized protein LOC125502150 [Athalia rosae]